MIRAALLAGGVLLLLLAAWLREPPARGGHGTLGAVGASMGGLRVALVDALFLRAEALRRRGRLDDAAGLYHAVLELDPANEAATSFLADLFVDGMLPAATDPVSRFLWWREARALLREALARRPRSPILHERAAALITQLPHAHPELEPALTRELGDWRRVALDHLVVAFEETGTLARRGRAHVVLAALLAPDVASRALVAGDEAGFREALAIARRLGVVRADTLAVVRIDPARPETFDELLDASIRALDAAARWRAGGGVDPALRADARAVLARVEALQPGLELSLRLREVLDAPR